MVCLQCVEDIPYARWNNKNVFLFFIWHRRDTGNFYSFDCNVVNERKYLHYAGKFVITHYDLRITEFFIRKNCLRFHTRFSTIKITVERNNSTKKSLFIRQLNWEFSSCFTQMIVFDSFEKRSCPVLEPKHRLPFRTNTVINNYLSSTISFDLYRSLSYLFQKRGINRITQNGSTMNIPFNVCQVNVFFIVRPTNCQTTGPFENT